jgi:hypothetical protein
MQKINQLKYLIYVNIQTPLLWYSKLSSGASCFHSFILFHLYLTRYASWEQVLIYTCNLSFRCFYNLIGGHLWSIQLIGHDLERHTPVYIKGPTVDSAGQSNNQTMRSKELSVELRERIVSRHRSGEGYQYISAALNVPKNTVASIILKMEEVWNHQESS